MASFYSSECLTLMCKRLFTKSIGKKTFQWWFTFIAVRNTLVQHSMYISSMQIQLLHIPKKHEAGCLLDCSCLFGFRFGVCPLTWYFLVFGGRTVYIYGQHGRVRVSECNVRDLTLRFEEPIPVSTPEHEIKQQHFNTHISFIFYTYSIALFPRVPAMVGCV